MKWVRRCTFRFTSGHRCKRRSGHDGHHEHRETITEEEYQAVVRKSGHVGEIWDETWRAGGSEEAGGE